MPESVSAENRLNDLQKSSSSCSFLVHTKRPLEAATEPKRPQPPPVGISRIGEIYAALGCVSEVDTLRKRSPPPAPEPRSSAIAAAKALRDYRRQRREQVRDVSGDGLGVKLYKNRLTLENLAIIHSLF